MTVETKFDLGEPVFYMENNQVVQSAVDEITISVRWKNGPNSGPFEYVEVRPSDPYMGFEKRTMPPLAESRCFRTKEELLASL